MQDMMIDRRLLLASAAATAGLAAAGFPVAALAQAALQFGPAEPFSFEALNRAARPYAAPPRPAPEVLAQIDYDAHGKIRFKTDLALWANGPSDFPVTFFHLGRYFTSPVRMHVVERGEAREIVYDDAYF